MLKVESKERQRQENREMKITSLGSSTLERWKALNEAKDLLAKELGWGQDYDPTQKITDSQTLRIIRARNKALRKGEEWDVSQVVKDTLARFEDERRMYRLGKRNLLRNQQVLDKEQQQEVPENRGITGFLRNISLPSEKLRQIRKEKLVDVALLVTAVASGIAGTGLLVWENGLKQAVSKPILPVSREISPQLHQPQLIPEIIETQPIKQDENLQAANDEQNNNPYYTVVVPDDVIEGTPVVYRELIIKASQKYDVPARILSALLMHESGFKPNARSEAGSLGIAQFQKQTAENLGINPFNYKEAIDGAARLMADLYKEFGNWPDALAAYNAGPNAVIKHNGMPPYRETRNHVNTILALTRADARAGQ